MSQYGICTRCVMDTTDPDIEFDEKGICNHCRTMEKRLRNAVKPEPRELNIIVDQIKAEGKGKKYDCILGVSGGVDSTYAAYLIKKMGLRALAVHMDNGWNSELAVKNVENFLNKLGMDLHTVVLDWEEFRDLQVSFLKASTPDSEVPSDHAIWAVMYDTAINEGIRYILTGQNVRTEGILPAAWSQGAHDWRYIRSLQKIFGRRPLKTFPHFTLTDRVLNHFVRKLKVVSILNYLDFQKEEAQRVLAEELGWRPYGVKHGESLYTRFYQSYILREKFGYDKRKAHLSSLIVSGQLTRAEALRELAAPPYSNEELGELKEYVLKKLELSEEDFQTVMSTPPKNYRDYPSYAAITDCLRPFINKAKARGILPDKVGL